MDLEHNFHNTASFYRQPTPLIEQQQNQQPESEVIKPSNESDYINEVLSRLLVHDVKRKLIERMLFRFFTEDLFGSKYIKPFLMRLYRYNCRANTIRGYTSGLYFFIRFLKDRGHSNLKTITRDDLGAFIESQQDRGLKPRTVRTRLNQVNAFLGFLIRRSIVSSDVLKRRLRVKVPDSLPKAIDPDDIQK